MVSSASIVLALLWFLNFIASVISLASDVSIASSALAFSIISKDVFGGSVPIPALVKDVINSRA